MMAAKKVETAGLPADFLASVEFAREAAGRGDPGPAMRLLQVAADEVRRCEAATTHLVGDHTERATDAGMAYRDLTFDEWKRWLRGPSDSRCDLLEIARLKRKEAAKAVAQASKRAAVVPLEGHAFATPETVTRNKFCRKSDPLAYMKLTSQQRWAAEEIRDVLECVVRHLMPGGSDTARVIVDGGAGFVEFRGLPERIAVAHAKRYLPWCQRNSGYIRIFTRQGVRALPFTGVSLAFQIMIEGRSAVDIERHHDIRKHGIISETFKRLMDDYGRRDTRCG